MILTVTLNAAIDKRYVVENYQIGEVFQKAFADGLCKREDLYIMTKVWNDMHGQGDVLIAVAKSLKDLQLD